jgi:hypothetical protein
MLAASGAGLAILAAAVWMGLSPPGPPLAAGERVLSTDPLVVQGAAAPAPRFSTWALGENVGLLPVTDTAAVVAEAEQIAEGGQILRITALGTTSRGRTAVVVHFEQDHPRFGPVQMRCVSTGSGSWCRTAGPADELLAPEPGRGPEYTEGGGRLVLIWEVSADTSVVMLTVNGDRRWMRPVSQIAVFDTELLASNEFVLTAFDTEGRVLDVVRQGLTTSGRSSEFSCPITFPRPDGFVPPSPYPPTPRPGDVWFGSGDLWTVLPIDGAYEPRKSVWWSVNFPGGNVEGEPPIEVSYERLDAEREPIVREAPGTNAYTDQDGWFMIASIDPDEPGCWRVTASYKGATVSYVYELPGS